MTDISHEPWDLHTLITNYNKGFKGVIYDPVHYNRLLESLPQPLFGDAGKALAGSGKGKLSLPFKSVLHFDPQAYTERQTTGDCFQNFTKVLMGNGLHKRIDEIKIGEEIITHNNKRRKVLNIIKKPYSGKMIKLFVKGENQTPIECTPDHKFIIVQNNTCRWKKAQDLEHGDRFLAPYGIDEKFISIPTFDLYEWTKDDPKVQDLGNGWIRYKGSRYKTKRYVELDEDLAWVIGMYLAEGGTDDYSGEFFRINFSLERHVEQEYADKICKILEEKFGSPCRQNNLPSKPTVTMVKMGNIIVGKFLKKLIPGNVYNKEFKDELLYTPIEIRKAILRGWLDGDGHLGLHKSKNSDRYNLSLGGATASVQMRDTLATLARSCGIKATRRTEPMQSHQTSDSYQLNISNNCVCDLYPDREQEIKSNIAIKELEEDEFNNWGQVIDFKKKEEYQVENIFVYCLEVEEEHTFVVSPLAVSNCVSHGSRSAADISRAVQIHVGHSAEGWAARGATEAIYGSRRHGGQGMACSQAAEFIHKTGGIVLRKKYQCADLSVYNASYGTRWGTQGVPQELIELARPHQAKTISLVRTLEEARDALANGYGLACCSNQGFSSVRDSKGFARPQGSWSHCLCVSGCDDTGSEISFLIQNSWGAWNSGPKPEFGIPDGSFMAHADVVHRMISGGGTFAYSSIDGFPPTKLPDYGTSSYL